MLIIGPLTAPFDQKRNATLWAGVDFGLGGVACRNHHGPAAAVTAVQLVRDRRNVQAASPDSFTEALVLL
jgi:hypothetical protein